MMMNKPNKYKYHAGDYVFALVSQHSGSLIPVYVLLRKGLTPKFDWVTGPMLIIKTGELGYSHGSVYVSDVVRRLTEVEITEAKLMGLV